MPMPADSLRAPADVDMRPVLVRLHRWFGIGIAAFLFLSGTTGAIIAWNVELDTLLNPGFYYVRETAPALSSLELANRVEAADPRLRITYLPLAVEPGHTLLARVEGRLNPATNKPYDLGFSQIAIDPATGSIQARREWGAFSVTRLNLLPFIYELHFTLHLPATASGIEIGVWLLGVVSIVWLVDSMIALALSFPSFKAWRKSLAFRVRRGGYALTFDLHRSGGVWVWGLLAVIALTSVSLNLGTPVVRPVVALFSKLKPAPLTDPRLLPAVKPGTVELSRERIVELAGRLRGRLNIDEAPGATFYMSSVHVYGVGYFAPGGESADGKLGNAWTYWDAVTGKEIGDTIPGQGSAGDVFLQAQFPLHSGRILGLPGRIMVSAMGVMIAILSATGLLIWMKKWKGRRVAARRARGVVA
jgi:uncharacterized iron-regulated membrane protein